MNGKTIAYYCQNCEKKFELPENQTPRCPNCYWTTSLKRADQMGNVESRRPAEAKKEKIEFPFKRIILPVLVIILAASAVYFAAPLLKSTPKNVFKKKEAPKPADPSAKKEVPSQAAAQDLAFLSSEEQVALREQVPFNLPRALGEEESGILNRKVEFTALTGELPRVQFWDSDKFEDFLSTVQKVRQIHFSGSYEGALKKLFKNHYLTAEQALLAGNIGEARVELLNALVFPVYQNDIRMHRSVALVMLKDYIDDVIAKIELLNAHIATQESAGLIATFQNDYTNLFSIIQQKDWSAALRLATKLEQTAQTIDSSAKQGTVAYPPVIAQIDPDIQRSLNAQDERISFISGGLNAVLTDLRIKKNVLEQNTDESLKQMKEKYDSAVKFINEKKWQEAKDTLEQINYPPEIAADAKQKLAIVARILDRSPTGN